MTIEPHELWAEVIAAGGPKRIAAAVGRNVATVYRWARNPMDVEDPDGTGQTGLFDWLEAVVDTLAARPAARVTLRKLQLYVVALFERALDRGEPRAESSEQLMTRGVTALREMADVLEECQKADPDEARLIGECLEVQEIISQIISAAEAGMSAEQRAHAVRAIK